MIKSIDQSTIHRISSGQVLVDLQTAIKELVENSLDAGATNIEVRLKDHGLKSIEIVDNGTGIAPEDYDHVARKHYTSKLSSFDELSTVTTFGFRGEALSSLCALSERVTITTATIKEEPLGTILELDKTGVLMDRSKTVARKAGTTVLVEGLFKPLPVRRKELERNAKREFAKALTLLSAYALVPCAKENKGVRLGVTHQPDGGKRTVQLRTDGHPSTKSSISALWGPKQVDSLVELDLNLEVVPEKAVLRRQGLTENEGRTQIKVRGYISKFSPGHGRAGTDRQFFFVNGRPCSPSRIQKAFNEVYKSFNTNQSPFIIADFVLPTDACDINVSPDKRTILLHSESNLVAALKESLEETFSPSRSTFTVQPTQTQTQTQAQTQSRKTSLRSPADSDSSSSPAVASSSQSMGEPHLLIQKPSDIVDQTPAASSSSDKHASSSEVVEATRTSDVTSSSVESRPSSRSSPITVDEAAVNPPLFLEVNDEITNNSTSDDTTQMDVDESQSVPSRTVATSIASRTLHTNTLVRPRSPSPPPAPPPANLIAPSPPPKPVQMILDTSNASWNIRRPQVQYVQRPAKKLKLDGNSGGSMKSTRQSLRDQLAVFAKRGAVMKQEEIESEGEEDEEMDELEGGDGDGEASAAAGNDLQVDEEANLLTENMDISTSLREQRLAIASETPLEIAPEGSSRGEPITVNDSDNIEHPDVPDVTLRPVSDTPPEPDSEYQDDSSSPYPLEVMKTVAGDGDASISFDLDAITKKWSSFTLTSSPSHNTDRSATSSTSPNVFKPVDDESATRELSRVIDKEDFVNMEVVGQFNLGFIIARNRVRASSTADTDGTEQGRESEEVSIALDDLFIVDQHAADEKYNFEKLQAETKMESQKLFAPRPLELTAAEELVALENIDILQNNGFEVTVDEDVDPGQGRIKLVAQPVSGSTTFDMKDLEELLHILQDQPVSSESRTKVRCSKVRAMFAMRACRKSIMIGKSLTKNQMTTVVRHMGTMEQPWNCPHGRPTMRHLVNLKGVGTTDNSKRRVDWDNL